MADQEGSGDPEMLNLIAGFESEYDRRCALIEKSTIHFNENLLPAALKKEFVRLHDRPIYRMKTKESAVQSVRKRNLHRLEMERIRDDMEANNYSWEDYWGNSPRLDDYGKFKNIDAMYGSLPDIGGIRILLYFPGDVDKVEKCLQDHPDIKLVGKYRRAQGITRDLFDMKIFLAGLKKRKAPNNPETNNANFPGYQATHFHVRPHPKEGEKEVDFIIEIQVRTLVMNAWSQVEHGIIYKAKDEVDNEMRAILDMFNGITMVGESALQQLDDVEKRKSMQRQKRREEFAAHIYDVGKWIGEYCEEIEPGTKLPGNRETWRYLDKLFQFLKARGEHSSGKLKEILGDLLKSDTKKTYLNKDLPLFMLRQRCNNHTGQPITLKDLLTTSLDETKSLDGPRARAMALRVVHCLNVAESLGVGELFISIMKEVVGPKDRLPTLLDFLNILHPDHCKYEWRSMTRLLEFCGNFLNAEKFRLAIERSEACKDLSKAALVELSRSIVEAGCIANPIFNSGETVSNTTEKASAQQVNIPRILCILTRDTDFTHWVPDLYHVAQHWGIRSADSSSSLSDRERQELIKHRRAVQTATGWNPVDVLGYNITEIIDDRAQDDRLRQMPKVEIELEILLLSRPHYKWVLRHISEGQFVREFHIDKEAKQRRNHSGHFVSINDASINEPKWSYMPVVPEWELVDLGNSPVSENLTFEPFERKKSEFECFFDSLLPSSAPIRRVDTENNTDSWILTLEGKSLSIKSTKQWYILAEAKTSRRDSDVTVIRRSETPQEEQSQDKTSQNETSQNGTAL
ncbi:hypothetical protein P153DRAFT_146816 [Dothidotthia symphoricarpi CBS 119687]|uniref:RelA/SpoT domain-containing protein n=1 Tax=Dothidotthia symphoricarpi CBS 119687 TaxID=1392245 RepID=A0A6A5ZW94_9PLEO|nr:uncharacterized protein P153DRAFT_146816 [Dothidotthia symphoricarpi CBS 119687]KAF2123799.1 hypothetical protein P153DRAFT_146816 [Dothidotthia symphoricarpi CBS 119687]